jgi:hypothetical protein
MADASRGLGYHHLVNVAQWHIGDEARTNEKAFGYA